MPNPSDRTKAFVDEKSTLLQDKEAWVVLQLNDEAVRSGKGQFLYLPESTESNVKGSAGEVKIESRVPRLVYVDHEWTEQECIKYWDCEDDAARYRFIQGMSLEGAWFAYVWLYIDDLIQIMCQQN